MDTEKHNLPSLFRQLGLPSDQADIAEFVDSHRPLADAVRLADAPPRLVAAHSQVVLPPDALFWVRLSVAELLSQLPPVSV